MGLNINGSWVDTRSGTVHFSTANDIDRVFFNKTLVWEKERGPDCDLDCSSDCPLDCDLDCSSDCPFDCDSDCSSDCPFDCDSDCSSDYPFD